jgi:hypothetical protein
MADLGSIEKHVIPDYSANHLFKSEVLRRLFIVRRWLALGVL